RECTCRQHDSQLLPHGGGGRRILDHVGNRTSAGEDPRFLPRGAHQIPARRREHEIQKCREQEHPEYPAHNPAYARKALFHMSLDDEGRATFSLPHVTAVAIFLTMSFVHLHCHSEYSLLDGANRIDDLIRRAKEYEQPALAITDHGNLHAAWEFQESAKKAGIKPIIGMEAYEAPASRKERGRPMPGAKP